MSAVQAAIPSVDRVLTSPDCEGLIAQYGRELVTEAVRAAAGNAAANGVGDLVAARLGDGYDAAALGAETRFDLIAANILAGPLQAMAPDLKRHLAPGGIAVLSGLLADQGDAVIAAHAPLTLARRLPLGDWVTLVLDA